MSADAIEAQIQKLLKAAEPLRALDEDDPAKVELAGIVDQINALRAQQEKQQQAVDLVALSEPKAVTVDRGALERRAVDLGLTFRANISDAKLAERIAEAEAK